MPIDQEEAFWDFYKSARHNKVLDPKTTHLIHLAVAAAVGCYPSMKYYLAQGEELGVTPDEIETVRAIAMAVSACKVMMQLDEVCGGKTDPAAMDCAPGC